MQPDHFFFYLQGFFDLAKEAGSDRLYALTDKQTDVLIARLDHVRERCMASRVPYSPVTWELLGELRTLLSLLYTDSETITLRIRAIVSRETERLTPAQG